jgi:hypothetical protein
MNKVADLNSDRNRKDWMQWKTGAATQDVPIPRGEARTGSGPMGKRWQTERKAGAQVEGGIWRLNSDEFGWSRTDDSINPRMNRNTVGRAVDRVSRFVKVHVECAQRRLQSEVEALLYVN